MKTSLKTLLISTLFFVTIETQAQWSVGAGLHFATGINNVGISANAKYDFNEDWAGAASYTYFFKNDDVTWSALDFDANYTLVDIDKAGTLYALAGLNLTFWKIKYDYGFYSGSGTGTDFGLNLGFGLNIAASETLNVAPEIRYTLGGANYFRIGVKVMYVL